MAYTFHYNRFSAFGSQGSAMAITQGDISSGVTWLHRPVPKTRNTATELAFSMTPNNNAVYEQLSWPCAPGGPGNMEGSNDWTWLCGSLRRRLPSVFPNAVTIAVQNIGRVNGFIMTNNGNQDVTVVGHRCTSTTLTPGTPTTITGSTLF